MIARTWKRSAVGARGRSLLAAVPIVACLVAATASGDGGVGVEEEMVGTLPSLVGDPEWSPRTSSRPAFYVEGAAEQVLRAIERISGSGALSIEPTVPGEIRVVFRGTLAVAFDHDLFRDGSVHAGLLIGPELGPVAIGVFHGGALIGTRSAAPASTFGLPMAQLATLGLLADGVQLTTGAREGGQALFLLHAHGGTLELWQQ